MFKEVPTFMSFSTLGLSASLVKAIAAQHYTAPFPIQQEAIPAILQGKDVLGIAPTGSGKTASFVWPVLEKLQGTKPAKNRFVKVLVLVPTRELAVQVGDVFKTFAGSLPQRIKSMAVYGGVSINPQMMQMSNVEVLVATPGRLLDLISSNAVHLSEVKMLVLDEADKMLNMGFEEEVNKILALLPPQRQNILFTATMDEELQDISGRLLSEPLRIEMETENPNPDLIKQLAYLVEPERKGPFLRYLIRQENMKQVLVFVSSTRTADNLVGKLLKNGLQAMALHSKKSQGARTDALTKFKAGRLKILVATDLASRGIDIQHLPYVINYDLPRSPKDYIHRIGRTGRAEAEGEAVSLVSQEDLHHFKIIQKKAGKKVSLVETADLDLSGY